MKSALFLLFLPVFSLSLSQTVTIGHESVPVEFYRMPDDPLDPTFKTYSTDVDMRGGQFNTGISEMSLDNEYLHLAGYEKLSRGGDIIIEVEIGDFNVYSERTGSQQTKTKDKDGKEVTKTNYYKEVRYSQPVAYRVDDKKGRTLQNEYIYNWTDDQTWRSSNYSTLSDLDRYWRSSRNYKLSELQRDRVKQGMKVISERINNLYGYRLINENERFEKIGKKRHPLYSDYSNAVATVEKAFKLMDADKPLTDVKKTVQPAIDFYKTADAKCKAGDKDENKLKHIGLYNLGLIYFWIEDFAQARKYTEAIYLFDEKDKDAKRLLEQIEYVESSLKNAKRTSRHQVTIGKA